MRYSFAATLFIGAMFSVIVLFVAPFPHAPAVLIALMLTTALPPALLLITDYSRLKPPNAASIIAPFLLSGSAAGVLLLTYVARPSLLLPVAVTLIVLTIGAFVVRWNVAVRAPTFFPAARA